MPEIWYPSARGKLPTRNKKPVAAINFSLETSLASRYIAIGGDQIELNPPSMPETMPVVICHPYFGPIKSFTPTKVLIEKATMAMPIEIVIRALGYDLINIDVTKIVIINAIAQYLYSIITCLLFLERRNWRAFVNIIGTIIKAIASNGLINNVNNAIAAAGSPIPKKPFTTPAI